MCGIFGVVSSRTSDLDLHALPRLLRHLYRLSESRGKEAAGIALSTHSGLSLLKSPERGATFIRRTRVREAILDAVGEALRPERTPFALIGHTRMVTNGSADSHGNNQPVVRAGLVCIHNGIVVNDEALWHAHPDLVRQHQVDTEALLAIAAERRSAGQSLCAAIACALNEARGANSVAVLTEDDDAMLLATTNGSLFVAGGDSGRETVFASERYILQQTVAHPILRGLFQQTQVRQLDPGEACLLSFADPKPRVFGLRSPAAEMPVVEPTATPRHTTDRSEVRASPGRGPQVSSGTYKKLEGLLDVDVEAIGRLRRCTKCLLPETFPFIRYSEDGVCSLCRQYMPLRRQGEDALRRLLQPFRRTDGRPECLFPLSGGRDSCYGIHYVTRVLGVKPVAYTYDWGMCTDLARRNISRMCGQLGIEHILVSADIRRKRDFIRMNVEAWLRRPNLGTVPLFMAGDKQYFYYAHLLKRQMDLGILMYSMNPLERTDFKVGFCGIDEGHWKEKHYSLSTLNQLRLAAFYGSQFLRNPAYLNASLLDSVGAYLSYYVLPKGYSTLYDYIDWNEEHIASTLIDGYDWETARDTKSTWRIGDGTAPFYNYIYLRVAGFSENDTLRSNLIREGKNSRESALALLESDNRPRAESIKWYCDTIGIDAERVIRRINEIPRLYA